MKVKHKANKSKTPPQKEMQSHGESTKVNAGYFLYHHKKIRYSLKLSELLYLKAEDKCTRLMMLDGKTMIADKPLCQCFEQLTSPDFVKIGCKWIVNLTQIQSFDTKNIKLCFANGEKIKFSPLYKLYFGDIFAQNHEFSI